MQRVMSRFLLIMTSLMLSTMLCVFGCSSSGGSKDAGPDCGNQILCNDGQCHNCCEDTDCSQGKVCEDYLCVTPCVEDGESCADNASNCCDDLACDITFTKTCVSKCTSDSDCATAHADVQFGADLKCAAGGYCEWQSCSSDGNCQPGSVCYNGDCVTPVDCSLIDSCEVVPAQLTTQNGTKASLSATALMSSGALAPGASFTWSVTPAVEGKTIATVESETVNDMVRYYALGGADSGDATITAKVTDCEIECTAAITNYGAVTSTARVVALDELTGEPLEGINVTIGEITLQTDANGSAEFTAENTNENPVDLSAQAATVTLHHDNYSYVSFVDANRNDLLAHLGKIQDPTKAGGYKGKFQFDKISCPEDESCDISLGITGGSIPGQLFNLNLNTLLGDWIMTSLSIGTIVQDIPLPGGTMFCLQGTCYKEDYRVSAVPGNRVAWGLGGKIDLATALDIILPLIGGGDLNIGELLTKVTPLFKKFHTGLVPNTIVEPIAKVVDTNDIDGDEDTTEFVADYDNFPALPGGDMLLKVPVDQELTVKTGTFPSKEGTFLYDGVLVLAGAMVRGSGMVPLGIGVAMDKSSDTDQADGKVGDIQVWVADIAGRLPEDGAQRMVLALALNLSGLLDENNDQPFVIAGQVQFVDSFNKTITLNDFLPGPEFTYSTEKELNITSLPANSTYTQLLFSGDTGSWHVLKETASGTFTLPDSISGTGRDDSASVVSLVLRDNVTYQDLIEFNGTNMADLVSLASDFVVASTGEGLSLGIDCSTTGLQGGLIGLFLAGLIGLVIWRRRRR